MSCNNNLYLSLILTFIHRFLIRPRCLFRLKAEEERLRKEEDKARKEFIKQEYLRRKQLKLMEDMDNVIKPRSAAAAKQRRSRPKSIHRDSMDSPKTPVRAATGNHVTTMWPPRDHHVSVTPVALFVCLFVPATFQLCFTIMLWFFKIYQN